MSVGFFQNEIWITRVGYSALLVFIDLLQTKLPLVDKSNTSFYIHDLNANTVSILAFLFVFVEWYIFSHNE